MSCTGLCCILHAFHNPYMVRHGMLCFDGNVSMETSMYIVAHCNSISSRNRYLALQLVCEPRNTLCVCHCLRSRCLQRTHFSCRFSTSLDILSKIFVFTHMDCRFWHSIPRTRDVRNKSWYTQKYRCHSRVLYHVWLHSP